MYVFGGAYFCFITCLKIILFRRWVLVVITIIAFQENLQFSKNLLVFFSFLKEGC